MLNPDSEIHSNPRQLAGVVLCSKCIYCSDDIPVAATSLTPSTPPLLSIIKYITSIFDSIMASQLASSGYVFRDSVRLFYESEGNKGRRTILFVHGLGATTNAYQPLIAELGDLHLVRFDWSGHGRSSVPSSDTSIELYVSDCEGRCSGLVTSCDHR